MTTARTSLFIVPTPIGNLKDITFRALEILQSVDTILAEDTRKSRILLNHYNIDKPLQSFHIFNEHKVQADLVKRLAGGEVMALVTDAGTPGISDPGFLLVREALKAGLKIETLPGATALIPALVNSGFPTDRFVFEGFLPHKKGRQTALKALSNEPRTIVLFESPHRLVKALEQMIPFFGSDRLVVVSRELTKIHEENFRGTLTDALKHFSAREVKGEIVMVINGKGE